MRQAGFTPRLRRVMRLTLLLLFLLGSSPARRRSGCCPGCHRPAPWWAPVAYQESGAGVAGRRHPPAGRERSPAPRRAGERGAGGTKRLLRPRLCSRRGLAPSPCRSPAPPPHRAARPGPADSLPRPHPAVSPPRHRLLLLPWLSQPPASSAAPRPPWRPCGRAGCYRRQQEGLAPRPPLSRGAHARCPVRSGAVPSRLTPTTAAPAGPPAPPSSAPRKHAAGESDVRPPAPPPAAGGPSSPSSGRSRRLCPPATPARPAATESHQSRPRRSAFDPRRGAAAAKAAGSTGGHTPVHTPVHTPAPSRRRRGALAAHKRAAPPRRPGLAGLRHGAQNRQHPSSAAPPNPCLWQEG